MVRFVLSTEIRFYVKGEREDLGLHMDADPACWQSPRNIENLF